MFQILPKDDGFTLPAFIKGRERMYGDTRIKFRPVLTPEWAEFVDKQPSSVADRTRHSAAGLVNSIVWWDCKGKDGKVAEINADTVLRLHRDLFMRLVDIVINSVDGGDLDPGEVKKLTKETEPLDDPFGRKAKDPSGAVREQQGN